MTPKRPSSHAASAVSALALAASLLAGCASSDGRKSGSGYSPGLMVASPGWLNGVLAPPESGTTASCASRYCSNPALRPNETWLGTIGLRQRLSDPCEVGVGVALPNLFPSDNQSIVAAERARDIGVGVWLKFDF